jgi:uracil-DNA glycosylase
MEVKIEPSWQKILQTEFDQPYFEQLVKFVKEEYATQTIFPPAGQIFNAFNSCPFNDVRVVILGQDPYHGAGQAHGLCFSVNDGVPFPPSLLNICKEMADDMGKPMPVSGNLQYLANQGVLLLNATLTVRSGMAGSHQGKGWETFTDAVIKTISDAKQNVVFLLWGAYAGSKSKFIDGNKHLILKAPHPSPLSSYRGFFGCKHFSQANAYLQQHGLPPIIW